MTAPNDASLRQMQAARPDMSTWLSANAGSGKTRVLTDRVARLLLDGVSPENILCLTYTKAAASEMQNRLFKRLGTWAMQADQTLRQDLIDMGAGTSFSDQALRHARTLFAKAIETPGGLKIQTIHSFCGSILRRFPLEAGVSPNFTEIDERTIAKLIQDVLEKMAKLPELDPAMTGLSHLTDDYSVASVIKSILANRDLFATQKTDAEIYSWFGINAVTDLAPDIRVHFDNADLKLIRDIIPVLETGKSTDIKNAASLKQISGLKPDDFRLLVSVFLTGAGAKVPFSAKINAIPTRDLAKGAAAAFIEDLDDLMIRIEGYRPRFNAIKSAAEAVALYRFAEAFLPIYAQEKQLRGWLDFEDLILKTRDLLNNTPAAAWVLYRLDGGIDHILVDEAQDTSPAQWDVIEKLAQEFTAGQGARSDTDRTVFVVGDKKQSIYSFQGADASEFDRMRGVFQTRLDNMGQPFQPLTLEYSFRSSAAILRIVDTVFDGRDASGFTVDSKHKAFKSDLPGRVDLWPAIEPDKMEHDDEWENPIDRLAPSDERVQLANQIADEIHRMITTPQYIPDDDGARPIRAGDIMILVQRRKELFSEIIRACKARGLPMAGADRLELQEELAVRDLIALLSFLVTPEDDLALAVALKSPLFGWDEQRLYTLAHHRTDKYLWTALRNGGQEYARELAILNDLRANADFLRPYDLIERILIKHQGRKHLVGRLGIEAVDGLDAFLSQALIYEQTEVPGLTGFISWFSADDLAIKRQMDGDADHIRVMTVHGSKGLESPIVFLPDCAYRKPRQDGTVARNQDIAVWKGTQSERADLVNDIVTQQRQADENERDRLLYVAMTRAEKWLIVAAAGKLGGTPPCWYDQIAAGMEKSGAIDTEFPCGMGKRVEHKIWPTQAQGIPKPLQAKTQNDLPKWANSAAPAPHIIAPTISPSDLGGAKALAGDSGQDTDAALRFGTQVHMLLEHLPQYPIDNWREMAAVLLKQGGVFDDGADIAFQQAHAVLTAPDLADLFGPDTLAEVPISARLPELGPTPIYGIIDRLIVTDTQVMIVDFKTNATLPQTADQIPNGILRQMAAYHSAVSQLYPNHSVECFILWTANAQLMAIPNQIITNTAMTDPLP